MHSISEKQFRNVLSQVYITFSHPLKQALCFSFCEKYYLIYKNKNAPLSLENDVVYNIHSDSIDAPGMYKKNLANHVE